MATFVQVNRNKAYMLEHISSVKKGLVKVIKHSFVEDSNLILCFVCSLGTAFGLVLLLTCFIWENATLGLSCIGLAISVICFAIFLYVVWKMD